MFGEPAPGRSEDNTDSWKPTGYLAWLEAKTPVRARYELLGYVGSGSVGSVFVARHIGFDETVALKFLQPRYLASADTTEQFVREARAGFKLRSEHIARVYDVDVHEGVPFIATELLEGETLQAVLAQRGALGRASSVDYALQMCEALACAHALGCLHLDIEPENVFVLGDEHIKLVDFGISQIASADGHSATLHYSAPERIRAGATVDARSDIWSVACVLYELLSGRAAFDRGGLLATCAALLQEEPVALTTLPDGLWSVIARCLQKSPDERFADVAELAAALEPFGSGRYSHYAERCRAQLRPSSVPPPAAAVASAPPAAAVASAPPAAAVASAPPAAAVVSVQATLVLGENEAPESPPAKEKPASRMATLAFDVSAFASTDDAVRELEAQQPLEPVEAAVEQPLESTPAAFVPPPLPMPTHSLPEMRPANEPPPRPGGLLLLMAAVLCVAWGGVALFSGPEKPAESPKLMHLVTPLEK